MEKLIFTEGGSAGFDVDLITIVTLYPVEIRNSLRREQVWVYEDDIAKQTRRVLQVTHVSTLAGRAPRHHLSELRLSTIYGYDQERHRWGPEERNSYLATDHRNTLRLLTEAKQLAELHLHQGPVGGMSYYRRTKA